MRRLGVGVELIVYILTSNALRLDGRRLAVERAEQDLRPNTRSHVDQRHGVGARVLELGRVEFVRGLEVDPELEALDRPVVRWIKFHAVLDAAAALAPLELALGK